MLQSPHLTLVLHPENKSGNPIIVLYDGSQVAQRALMITAGIGQDKHDPLIVLLLAEEPEEAERLHQGTEDLLKAFHVAAHYHWQSEIGGQGLLNKIQAEGCQLVAVPGNGSRLDSNTILLLLESLECPVLLVR